ncbi:MAG: hypothetical protein ABII90_05385 [Bacteroidota bacterium]
MTGISMESLKEGIKKCDANIVIFEDAIKKERATQEEYREIIYSPESNGSGFNIESLKEGVKSCDAKIVIFENAIKKERQTQEDYRFMIETAIANEEKRNLVNNGVEIEKEEE